MAKDFDPRRILRKVSNSLLRVCFERNGVIEGIPWDDLGETQVEPIFAAWQKMPEDKRRHIHLVLLDINELADERGVRVLVEEIQRTAPDRLDEFHAITGQADRAMWTYLNVKMAFVVAAYFARAEALSTGRYWIKRNSLPKQAIAVTQDHREALKTALAEFYWDEQLRGRICEIEHYTRSGGSEYFFAYLDDYPDDPVVFDDDGHLVRSKERRVFDNVFVFNPGDGSLEMYAKGGKKVYEPLQQRFCKAVLGLDVGPADPQKPAYTLDHLLRPDRVMRTDPGDRIISVAITRVRLAPVLTRKDFMGNHEWCFYGWREGAGHQFYGPNNVPDVWSIKKVNPQSMVHLTEKPVELARRAIEYSSKPGENVLDLFGGSGSTLMACEQAGRRGFLMELDPLYTDVIVQRWESFTGKKAEREAAAGV
ncbi:MAG: site-specific DNA-methyltransferase [Phycisphaerales bacterium]|nr:site-specific DNA-methyltransferase [Phycisphaerales bacterium]